MSWFNVDKDGLAALIEHRGKAMLLFELVQNAWDTAASEVHVTLTPVAGCPRVEIEVRDNDPHGFNDLSHAWTLFAPSSKKADPTRRGRFNLGEKLVLALCHQAEIQTVSGGVLFLPGEKVRRTRKTTNEGTIFTATMKMTRDELHNAVLPRLQELLAPPSCQTFINGKALPVREPCTTFQTTLMTEVAGEDGALLRRLRKTDIQLFRPFDDEQPHLYEMGIPVCPIDVPFHVNVGQKIPMGFNRDSVSSAYRRHLHAAIVNEASSFLDDGETEETWVSDAFESSQVSVEAVGEIVRRRFGRNGVTFDPSDLEANQRAASKGWKVVHGSTFSKAAWKKIRESGALPPAGQKIPTPKPYSTDPNAPMVDLIPRADWTTAMREVCTLARWFARELGITSNLDVRYVRSKNSFMAAWGNETLDFNVQRIPWLEIWKKSRTELLDLLIHEYAHHFASSHLSEAYHNACTRLGARMAMILSERRDSVPGW